MKCIICNSQMRIYSAGEKWTYWKCSKCHFYATSANEKNIDFAMDYDEYETFDAETEYEKNVKYTKKLLQYKFDLIKYIPNSFLDYGCSEGCFVEAFSKINPGGHSAGIEVSIPKINRAKEKGLYVGTENDIQGKYEFILVRHVVEHVENPKEFVAHIVEKYLANDGIICIETPNNESLGCRKRGKIIREDRFCLELFPPTHVCGFTIISMRRLAKGLGLKEIFSTTYELDDNWIYPPKYKKITVNNKIKSYLHLNENIAVFLKKVDIMTI